MELTVLAVFCIITAMNTIPVMCQRCGAPLEVADESVRFVTCAHCSTPLEIVREATQTHSRIMEEIHAATTESAKTLKVIELQNDLERLDREWAAHEPMIDGALQFSRESNGRLIPAVAGGLLSLVMVYYGVVTKSFIPPLVALIPVTGIYIVIRGIRKAGQDLRVLEDLASAHDQRRRSLILAIEEAKRA